MGILKRAVIHGSTNMQNIAERYKDSNGLNADDVNGENNQFALTNSVQSYEHTAGMEDSPVLRRH